MKLSKRPKTSVDDADVATIRRFVALNADIACPGRDKARRDAQRRYQEMRKLPVTDSRINLASLPKLAKPQQVTLPDGDTGVLPVITATALGELLDISCSTVTRWLAKNMLPQPLLLTVRGHNAYHVDEASSFIRIIGAHQQTTRQYRPEHILVTDALFRENALLRKSLFYSK